MVCVPYLLPQDRTIVANFTTLQFSSIRPTLLGLIPPYFRFLPSSDTLYQTVVSHADTAFCKNGFCPNRELLSPSCFFSCHHPLSCLSGPTYSWVGFSLLRLSSRKGTAIISNPAVNCVHRPLFYASCSRLPLQCHCISTTIAADSIPHTGFFFLSLSLSAQDPWSLGIQVHTALAIFPVPCCERKCI